MLLFAALGLLPSLTAAGPVPNEDAYLKEKESGRYLAALNALHRGSLLSPDPQGFEADLFRMMELMRSPELASRGLAFLEDLKKRKADSLPPQVRDRLDLFLSRLYLKCGDAARANKIMENFSCLGFHVIGPFKNSSPEDFRAETGIESEFNRKKVYRGKTASVSWFTAVPDLTGRINLADLLPDLQNSAYYLRTVIFAPDTGDYDLCLGKTGFLDLRIDGRLIFSSRDRHGFINDQYFIRVRLSRGKHEILIKAGDSGGNLKISLRMADAAGNRVDPRGVIPKGEEETLCEPVSVSLMPCLEALRSKKNLSSSESFTAGYLYHIAKLEDPDNPKAYPRLQAAAQDSIFASSAFYYLSRMERSPERKDFYLKQSLSSNPENAESLYESALLRIRSRNFYESFSLIEQLKSSGAEPHFYLRCLGTYLLARGWDEDALKAVSALKTADSSGAALDLDAKIKIRGGEYSKAADILKKRMQASPFSRIRALKLATCLAGSGRGAEAVTLLLSAARLHPNDVRLLLRLAEIAEGARDIRAAMPYLTLAEKISPSHPRVLESMGKACHRLGKKNLAIRYITRSLAHDPANHELRSHLDFLNRSPDPLGRHLFGGDVGQLARQADPYQNESAVILLSETAYRVNTDGSSEKHTRRIVRINDDSAIREFKLQYIVFDPATESIEDFRCEIITPSGRVPVTRRYRRSLSDPESRLYYDAAMEVIPLDSLVKGALFDMSYRIRTRDRKEFKNYFGEKIYLGDRYRTLKSRVVLVHPDEKKIFCHLRAVPSAGLSSVQKHGSKTITVVLDGIPPYKKESSMTHPSEFLPSVYFTSFSTWGDMVSWYRPFLKNGIRLSKAMKSKVSDLVRGAEGDLDKVDRIYGHVTSEIRYVGLELGIGGIQPRNTDSTYSSKMGDCKDVSLLLAVLLREAGIDANLALVRTRDKGAPWLKAPYIGEFNHAICSAVVRDGTGKKLRIFLDGTSKNTGLRELPADDRAVKALVIDDRTDGKKRGKGWVFAKTENGFYHKNRVIVVDEISLKADGGSHIIRTIAKKGTAAPQARSELTDIRFREKFLTEYWNEYFPGARVSGLAVKSADRINPVTYSYAVEVPSFSQSTDTDLIFNAFINQSGYHSNYASLSERRFPVSLQGPSLVETRSRVRIPKGYYPAHVPKDENFRFDSFEADFRYRINEDVIEITSRISVNSYSVRTDQYRGFREFAEFVGRKELEKIVLTRKNPSNRKAGETP